MNKELIEALNLLEKEKNISKATLLEAIENSLLTACKNHFGKADNIKVNINPDTCDFSVYAEKEVVEEVEDPLTQISLRRSKTEQPEVLSWATSSTFRSSPSPLAVSLPRTQRMSSCRRSVRKSAACSLTSGTRRRRMW